MKHLTKLYINYAIYDLVADVGTEVKDLYEPNFWINELPQLNVGDIIYVTTPDYTIEAKARVVGAGSDKRISIIYAYDISINDDKFISIPVKKAKAINKVDVGDGKYTIQFKGNSWCVIDSIENSVVASMPNKAAAIAEAKRLNDRYKEVVTPVVPDDVLEGVVTEMVEEKTTETKEKPKRGRKKKDEVVI